MSIADHVRTIAAVRATGPLAVAVTWSDGTDVELDVRALLDRRAVAVLRDPTAFEQVAVGDWGHSLAWPSGVDLGADTLWLDTLSARGRDDVRAFLEWRLRHGLSLSKTADALGISRRMVAYYSNGEKKVPKPVLLACKGWEVSEGRQQAA